MRRIGLNVSDKNNFYWNLAVNWVLPVFFFFKFFLPKVQTEVAQKALAGVGAVKVRK
jgi:hypothetical protein